MGRMKKISVQTILISHDLSQPIRIGSLDQKSTEINEHSMSVNIKNQSDLDQNDQHHTD